MNPWLILGLVLAFAGTFYAGYQKGDTNATARAEVRLLKERADATSAADKARIEWEAKVAERDTSIKTLQDKQVADSASFLKQLEDAKKVSSATTREVNRVTREKPIAASCALSAEYLSLRNKAIREANATANGVAETSASGLPGNLQGDPARDSRIADWGTERDLSGGRLDYQDLWRVPSYTHSAG